MKYSIFLIIVFSTTLALAGTVQETRHFNLSIQGIDRLVVSCGAGSLDLKGVAGLAKISITAEIEGEGFTQEELQSFIENHVRLYLEKQNSKAFLRSEASIGASNAANVRVNLKIEIPEKLDVKITDGSGSIKVQNLLGDLIIDDDTGKIQVDHIIGEVTVFDGSGKIQIEDISGNVMVRDGSGSIAIDYIKGDVYVTDGSGDTTILHIEGNVIVTDSSGDIDISDVSGTVFISEAGTGELNIDRTKGKIITRE